MDTRTAEEWAVRLFDRSVLKQRKYREIVSLLGTTEGLRCLDIGSDNGVISYLLRRRGGSWKSADLDPQSVHAIRELVRSEVYQIDGRDLPFADDEFDAVVIVDFLEHTPYDRECIDELYRVLKPGGTLILNVPHSKETLLRRFRHAIGQSDEQHGHLRPGYTIESLQALLGQRYMLEHHRTYSKFFSELIDTLVVYAVSLLKRRKAEVSPKGMLVTGDDLHAYRRLFRVYSLIYPIVWLVSRLDALLVSTSGYMLIARARAGKESGCAVPGEGATPRAG